MTPDDTLAIEIALRFAIRRCVCGGLGHEVTWDLNEGPPVRKCKVCKPYRIALAKLLKLARVTVAA